MSVWTKQVVKRFNQLFAEGLPYGKIAARLSKEFGVTITRNAAIGFRARRSMTKREPYKPGQDPAFVPMPYKPPLVINKGTLRIEQLKPTSCRWPFGDRAPYLFCGCTAVEGRPYCEDHMKLGHQRWQPSLGA